MLSQRAIRRISVDGCLIGAATAAMAAAAHPSAVATALGLGSYPWANRLFTVGVFTAMAMLCVLGYRILTWLAGAVRRWRSAAAAHGSPCTASAGTIMVEFALALPIIGLVTGMVIQLALLANASLVVRYAAFAAARTAIISFERPQVWSLEESLSDEPEKIDLAAHLVLATISPRAGGSDQAAWAMRRILERQHGPWGDRHYHERMSYARAATTVTKEDSYPEGQISFINLGIPNIFAPKQVDVTVKYDFLITIPGLYTLPFISKPAPGGVSGHVFTIEQTVRLQSTGARQSSPASMLGGSPEL